ncbi:hypothetical protein GGI12_005632 [Dipsacomyces acuminosporus]|nr:hypothetical protein GGI12_005632 [Dipsacomyces acuminosporus]
MDTISSDASGAPKKPRVEDMFDDDDFEDTPTNRAKSEDKAQGDDFAAESMDVDAESDDKPSEPTSASESKTTPEQLQPDGRNRVRKRRKVSRIKHTKNSRGILMTQTVDEWESYSESESEPQARPKKTHVRGKAAEDKQPPSSETKQSSVKGKKPAQHRSLLSFFGKK